MKYFVYIFILSFIFFSCSSSKKTVKGPPPDRTKEELISALLMRNYDFTWFNGKASTELKSPDENVSGSIHIRMKKDSVVWMAVKKFGIEAARVQVDKSHYTILYRLEGLYQKGRISEISDILNISLDFEDLQHLIFGNVILPDTHSVEIITKGPVYILKADIDGIVIEYKINAYDMRLEGADITDRQNRKASIYYNEYRISNNGRQISFERKLEFPYNAKDQAIFYLKFSEIEVDVPVEIKFNIPKSYSEIF